MSIVAYNGKGLYEGRVFFIMPPKYHSVADERHIVDYTFYNPAFVKPMLAAVTFEL